MKTDFRGLRDEIRRRILSGAWERGMRVPNEVDLAEEFGCARATINRAMRELAEEGLIERKRKAGSRVLSSPVRQARFEIPIVRREIEDSGRVYRYQLLFSEIVEAPEWLAARMGLAKSARVRHLHCLHFADDLPYQFEDRWISLSALPEAKTADFGARGPNEWLVSVVPFSDAEIGFSATAADAQVAKHLGCVPGDPVFLAERSTWWQDKAITYVRLTFQRGHKMTTRY